MYPQVTKLHPLSFICDADYEISEAWQIKIVYLINVSFWHIGLQINP